REIHNVEEAMDYVEATIKPRSDITHTFVSELHALVVRDLSINQEGDRNPGIYRCGDVHISGSNHLPPSAITVRSYIDELLKFINSMDPPKYDLLKTALAHHRFVWIHPFSNGNGRVVRLLTYALLIKFGFNVSSG